jgi:ornithine cyclodeaminase/alanine dehydrogenase-like protein (mu-crystallin family)
MTIRLLNQRHVQALAPDLRTVISLVEQAYRLDAEGMVDVPTKIGIHPTHPKSFLHAMPAWVDGVRALGMKWISYFPGNLQRDIPNSTGIIILNDPDDGQPCCIMEGMQVTLMRTAACAAIAAKHLLTSPPKSLGLVGCGELGLWSLRLMVTVFTSIERVMVSSRSLESRKSFCAKHSSEGPSSLIPAARADEAVCDIDVVVSSVPPGDAKPVHGNALKPGGLFIPLDVTNSWDDSVMQRAERVVADNPGDFSARVQSRRGRRFSVLANIDRIQDVVVGRAAKSKPSERTVVAVCGIASTDLVLAWEIYRRALTADVGSKFDLYGA